MKRRKFTLKEKIALAVLVVLMLAVIAVGAVLIIGNANESNSKLYNTEHTTMSETLVKPTKPYDPEETEATAKPQKKATKPAEPEETSVEKATEKPTSAPTEKPTEKKAEPATKAEERDYPEVIPETNPKHKSRKELKVNGTTCYVGDKIKVTLNLKSPVILENFQGRLAYNGEYLKFEGVTPASNVFANEVKGEIFYNASVITGIDLKKPGTLLTATFKVRKEGETYLANTPEVLTDMDDQPVDFDKAVFEIGIYA